MTTRYHMAQSVRGPLMNWSDKEWRDATKWMKPNDGGSYTGPQLKAEFLDLLAAGNEVIPIGEPCDNFDPKTGCKGHPVADESVAASVPAELSKP